MISPEGKRLGKNIYPQEGKILEMSGKFEEVGKMSVDELMSKFKDMWN